MWCWNGKGKQNGIASLGDEGKVGFKMNIQHTQNWLERGGDSSREHSTEPFMCLTVNRNAEIPQSWRVTKRGWTKGECIHMSPCKTSIKIPAGNQKTVEVSNMVLRVRGACFRSSAQLAPITGSGPVGSRWDSVPVRATPRPLRV